MPDGFNFLYSLHVQTLLRIPPCVHGGRPGTQCQQMFALQQADIAPVCSQHHSSQLRKYIYLHTSGQLYCC